jgi:hypothetical protein
MIYPVAIMQTSAMPRCGFDPAGATKDEQLQRWGAVPSHAHVRNVSPTICL